MKRSSPDLDQESPSFEIPVHSFGSIGGKRVAPETLRTEDPNWLLIEEGLTLAREHEIESLFAIANGYVGNRGSLAEGSPLSAPATFVAGIFEHPDTQNSVPQLMVLPDWTAVRIWIN